MAEGPNYRVSFRRRRKGKTDYKARRALVLSRLPRLVIRGTLKNMIVQVIQAKTVGDVVIASAHSKELEKNYGWKGNNGNISAAYLTGLLCGQRAIAAGVKKSVLDLGLQFPSKGAKIFASLKGFVDAGVSVPYAKDVLPNEKRIRGEHVAAYASKLASNPEAYQKQFSNYLSKELQPEKLPEHFSNIKEKIMTSVKESKS